MSETVSDIRIKDFDYPLPDERIPRHPLAERDRCKLLVSRSVACEVEHRVFADLPALLPADTLLVCNNTRVINARIRFRRATGAEIEVFLLEPMAPADYALMFAASGSCRWNCIVGNLKRWKDSVLTKALDVKGRSVTLSARRIRPMEGNAHEVELSWDAHDLLFADIVEAAGYIPIPPYLRRQSEECDATDYQTVYSRVKGSVAAPTAGLHFTDGVLADLKARGIERRELTLHVGAGTFQPVKSDTIGEHPMHTETFCVERSLVDCLIGHLEQGSPLCAVGTTTVRTLESLPYMGAALMRGDMSLHVDQWDPYRADTAMSGSRADTLAALRALADYMDNTGADSLTASTSIMIAPGFRWQIVDVMVTNFHQPQSTLLLLVSSFLGDNPDGSPRWRDVYREALDHDYRFLSYGDACLFINR